jgi:Na+-driven multidrug efflux pump
MALSASIGPFVGQNWGGKQYGRVAEALKQSYIFCLGWGFLMAIALALFGSQLAQLFNDNGEVVKVASTYLWLVPITYGAGGIIQVASSAFNALGKPIPAITMTALRMFVFYIPFAYLGSRLFGITGVFAAATLANAVVGIVAFWWSGRTQKKLIACMEVETAQCA